MNKPDLRRLFEPSAIGKVSLKNRIVMPAIATNFNSEMGEVTDRLINFLEERARGGAGLIIVESAPVDKAGSSRYTSVMVDRDDRVPRLQDLTRAIHKHGCPVAIQLSHAGRFASIRSTHLLSQSASGLAGATAWDSSGGQDEVRQITKEEIPLITEKFGEAARRAKEAGFDAVEIHGAHGLLIHEFLSPLVNKRTDGYGGDLQGRVRFPVEVLRAMRRKVGKDFPIIFRISAEEGVEKGLKIQESKLICQVFEKEGADAIDVSSGTAVTYPIPEYPPFPPMAFRRGIFVRFAEEIKKSVKIPVIAVGRINDPRLANKILENGKADLIGMARGLIADPELPRKAAEGSFEDIRFCIACGICLHNLFQRRPMECLVNPAVGREREFAVQRAKISKKIMVVGGGPAGMEAARVASLRGHKVVMYEKEDKLGGQLNLAVIPPHRGEIKMLIRYLTSQIKKSGVEIHCGREATSSLVEHEKPEEVIVATGARPAIPKIPGVDLGHVVTAWDVLSGTVRLEKKAVIEGGGRVGCETAEFLAGKGLAVVIAEPSDMIGRTIEQNERRYLLQRLKDYGVEMLTNVKILEIQSDQVILGTYGDKRSVECDQVVLANSASPCRDLVRSLKGIFPNFFLIGDALDPRTAKDAIYEGSRIARLL